MGPDVAPDVGVPLTSAAGNQGFAMGLAVPGLTVPWGHAGYLWLATAASIAVHEVTPQALWQAVNCTTWVFVSATVHPGSCIQGVAIQRTKEPCLRMLSVNASYQLDIGIPQTVSWRICRSKAPVHARQMSG